MRWLIVGGTGLLGSALRRALSAAPDADLHATWHRTRPDNQKLAWHQLDVAGHAACAELFAAVHPDIVINVAYAKSGPELDAVTAQAPGHLAELSARHNARFVHVSSDAIFDGPPGYAHREGDTPNPCTAYGRAKLASESLVRRAGGYIARSSILYGGATTEPQLQLVTNAVNGTDTVFFTDEVRCPAHVDDVAGALVEFAGLASPPPVVHLGGADAVHRLTFAQLIARSNGLSPEQLIGAPTPPGLVRPKNSALSAEIATGILSRPIPGVHQRLA